MSSIKRKKINQTILISVLVLIALLAISIELVPQKISQSSEVQKLNSTDVYSRLQSGEKIIILDVREENEFLEEHIPNAIWFPKSKFDKNDPSVMEILENLNKSDVIITYCGAGHRSGWVALNLKEMGYESKRDGI